jgi:hypothetical protein
MADQRTRGPRLHRPLEPALSTAVAAADSERSSSRRALDTHTGQSPVPNSDPRESWRLRAEVGRGWCVGRTDRLPSSVTAHAPASKGIGGARSRAVDYCTDRAPLGGRVRGRIRTSTDVDVRGGQALARCQGEGRGFESRRPLQKRAGQRPFRGPLSRQSAPRSTNSQGTRGPASRSTAARRGSAEFGTVTALGRCRSGG